MTLGVSGVLCVLKIEGCAVAESRSFTPTLNQATIDLTNRDSAWWDENISGRRDWAIDGDGLYIYSDPADKVLRDHYFTRLPATITVELTLADGTQKFAGEAVLTSLSFPAPHEDAATKTFSLKGTGALTPTPAS